MTVKTDPFGDNKGFTNGKGSDIAALKGAVNKYWDRRSVILLGRKPRSGTCVIFRLTNQET